MVCHHATPTQIIANDILLEQFTLFSLAANKSRVVERNEKAR